MRSISSLFVGAMVVKGCPDQRAKGVLFLRLLLSWVADLLSYPARVANGLKSQVWICRFLAIVRSLGALGM